MVLAKLERIYWSIYRWFKWDFKHIPSDVKQGIVNLYKWRKVTWKDRDWDYYFILEPMKFKMKNTLRCLEKYGEDGRKTKYLKLCISLIEKLQKEQYLNEWFEYCKIDIVHTNTNSNINQVKYEYTENNFKEYIRKYPHAKKLALRYKKHEQTLNWGDYGLCMVMGIVRHEKARRLLFKIIDNEIENWWT